MPCAVGLRIGGEDNRRIERTARAVTDLTATGDGQLSDLGLEQTLRRFFGATARRTARNGGIRRVPIGNARRVGDYETSGPVDKGGVGVCTTAGECDRDRRRMRRPNASRHRVMMS